MSRPIRTVDELAKRLAAVTHATVATLKAGDRVSITVDVHIARVGFDGKGEARYEIKRAWNCGGVERSYDVESAPTEVSHV